ncbi:peptidyl-prolyl cis-trans isomerase (survival protein) [Cytophaga hutchinsonii ATCC 33406]|uniref:Peptidyl-prolyl cis-trans isomerase (Survival protein) n=2 Tax=Cytophaga hutchinsonii TaxID=985 RepID=A0A6N4SMI6_CYTH3|nr:peptidyl-prolyl cis-trans isomerase (survival protein) [Cytophaga hutchinsonii ATCC 33406]
MPLYMLLRYLFVFFVFVTNYHFCAAQQVIDKIVAKVDNQIVLKSEVEISYLQFMRSPEAQMMQTTDDIKCRVLESLIINKMLLARAVMDSVTVEREIINQQIDRRMDYFIQQFGTVAKLESYYNKSIDQLKEELYPQIRDQMVTQKMQDNITAGVTITPNDVKKFYKALPADSLPYFSSEVEVGQIIRLPEINRQDQLKFKQKLEEIRQRVASGEDFCRLAKQFSQDPVSAKNCGEIGFFKKGELVPEYEAAASKLQPGQTSGVIETQYGYHIVQLIERRGAEYNTRHILIKPASSSKDLIYPTLFLDSLRLEILKDSISFAKAAKNYSSDKQTAFNGGMLSDPESGSSRIAQEDLPPAIFFVIDTMKIGEISMPAKFTMEDGTEAVRIVYFKNKIPAHQANLKDDYQKIYSAALEEKKNNAVNEWFDKTKSQVYIDIDDEYKQCEIMIIQK